jgi:hypothetical protein
LAEESFARAVATTQARIEGLVDDLEDVSNSELEKA